MKKEVSCSIVLGGIPLELRLRFPETARYFRKYLRTETWEQRDPVFVSDRAFSDWAGCGNAIDAFAEFCLLCQPVSEGLMGQGGCVFHGAALRCGDRAILLSGGSGAGKSTHVGRLLAGHGEDFSVINGDKPVLTLSDSGVTVHPSPWNGKEGLHGGESAPLAAIYFLHRCEEDGVESCTPRKAGAFAFPMVFQSFYDENVIRAAAAVTEKIITAAPCFLFHTHDIEASSQLLYRSIKEVSGNGL